MTSNLIGGIALCGLMLASVLDGNPIASVQHLHRISAVVRGGTFYSKADLQRIRQRALPAPP